MLEDIQAIAADTSRRAVMEELTATQRSDIDREHAIRNAYERSVNLAPKVFEISASVSISSSLRQTVTSTKLKTAWELLNKGETLDSSMDADRLYRS